MSGIWFTLVVVMSPILGFSVEAWLTRRWTALLWIVFLEALMIPFFLAAAATVGWLIYVIFFMAAVVWPAVFLGSLIRLVFDALRARLNRASLST